MNAGQRKLLPYEYQLIDALGITKDEYLDFVQYQGIYRDVKQDTALDIRNWETVAIVMTVVGMLTSVAGVVFAPKPKFPDASAGSAPIGAREGKFAPRYGFNSQQPLAIYGDPINLIYANASLNPYGGVRAASSLLWSAVRSFGNSQFVELLMLLGGGTIGQINPNLSAFGQTPLRDLISENYWIYFAPDSSGRLKNSHQLPDENNNKKSNPGDPSKYGNDDANPYRVDFGNSTKQDGFSQAYSPTNSNEFGVYSPVPINVQLRIRNSQGDVITGANDAKLQGANGVSIINGWPTNLYGYKKGDEIQLKLLKTDNKGFLRIPASELREGHASGFDSAGTYKLGAAVFKVIATKGNIVENDMIVTLKCIENGKGSSIKYDAKSKRDVEIEVEDLQPQEFKQVRRLALKMLRLDDRLIDDITGEIVTSGTKQDGRQLNARELAQDGTIKILKKKNKSKKIENWTYESPGDALPAILKKGNLVKKNGDITPEGKQVLNRYADLADSLSVDVKDNYFFIKALARIEEASYETVSPCSIVDLALKARVYKRVSGRQSEYGSAQRASGHKQSDNGSKMRSSMFTVKFKYADQTEYTYFPGIFVVRRTGETDNYVYLRFLSHLNPKVWQFVLTPVFDVQAEVATHPQLKNASEAVQFHYIDNNLTDAKLSTVYASGKWSKESADVTQPTQAIQLTDSWLNAGGPVIQFAGRTRNAASKYFPPINATPRGMNEWDLFTVNSENNVNFSFEQGPEFSLVAVTEQTIDSFLNYPSIYQNLSLLGLNMYSGRTIQDLRSFTVFVEKGKKAKLLNGSTGYPCHAPNIFYDTAIDKVDGIGQYSSDATLDLARLKESQKFCEENDLFMEGVFSEEKSWRAFWSETAHYSLLELAKIGGKDTLIPAVPYNSDGSISTNAVNAVALFNQGNILEGTYKEEFVEFGDSTQDTVVSAIYREQRDENSSSNNRVFALNQTVEVRYKDSDQASITRTTVDMSQYVTRRDQAILVAKFLCALKRYTTKNVEFQTFPTASAVAPGDYIYVELAQNKWDNIYTGVIGPGGALNTAFGDSVPNGTYNFLVYNPNTKANGVAPVANTSVSGNTASSLKNYEGQLFVLGTAVKNKRLFKVTEVTMEEEGETTIRATEFATDSQGKSRINQDILGAASKWLVDGK